MIYELRIYHMYEGRQDAICRRFADHTLDIFARIGIKVTDFWVDAQNNSRIYYVCEFEDITARDSAWLFMQADEEWIHVRAASEEDGGPIVEKVESFIMTKAPFFKD